MSDEDDDFQTVKRKQKRKPAKIIRKNNIFYTVKLYTKGGGKPLKTLQLVLRTWFKTMKSGANSTVIYKPGSKNTSTAITSPMDISSNLQQLWKCFIGICPRTNPGDIWFQVKIGINKSEDEFHANTAWWFQDSQSAMFKKALQEHNTVRELWLLFSHERMNLEDLTLAIEDYA